MNTVLEWAVSSVYTTKVDVGAIDVVAVQRRDGSIRCSPFHVKIGMLLLSPLFVFYCLLFARINYPAIVLIMIIIIFIINIIII